MCLSSHEEQEALVFVCWAFVFGALRYQRGNPTATCRSPRGQLAVGTHTRNNPQRVPAIPLPPPLSLQLSPQGPAQRGHPWHRIRIPASVR